MMDYTDTRLSRFISNTGDPASMTARINQKYAHDFQVTPEEQQRIAPLVKEMAQQLYQERRQFGTSVLATLDAYHEKISEQMTPDQRTAYQKANDERKKWLTELLISDLPPTATDNQK